MSQFNKASKHKQVALSIKYYKEVGEIKICWVKTRQHQKQETPPIYTPMLRKGKDVTQISYMFHEKEKKNT